MKKHEDIKIYNFIKYGKVAFIISTIAIFLTIVVALFKGLPLGIDFLGGDVVQIKYEKQAPLKEIRELLYKDERFANSDVINFGSDEEILIKVSNNVGEINHDIGDILTNILKPTGSFTIRRTDVVGPKIGDELTSKGLIALILTSLAIIAYVTFRYDIRFAIAAIVALFHDVILAVGAMIFVDMDITSSTIAALLTIIGYSINDTVIVFDRIREKIMTTRDSDLKDIINNAVSSTLSRTILTSVTVFFVIVMLYIFGGKIIESFSYPMLIGVVVGTYSSIFIAAEATVLLKFSPVEYREKELKKIRIKKEKHKNRAKFEGGVV